jgi:hypothetical protein
MRWPDGSLSGRPYIYAPNAVEDHEHGRHVAELCAVNEVEANARLIAAAPETAHQRDELLEVLKAVAKQLECPARNTTRQGDGSVIISSDVRAAVHAAIAKAGGAK